MGFSLKDKLKEATAQLNPFDGGKTAATVRAALPAPAPVPTVSNAKYGVLANNPQAQQQFQNDVKPVSFNPLKAAPGAFGGAVHKVGTMVNDNLINPVVNTAQVPLSAARFGIAKASGNQVATDNARTNLQQDLSSNLFSGNVPFEKSIAATINQPISNFYANREADRATRELTPAYENLYRAHGMDPRLGANQASIEADQAKQGFIQDQLQRAGLNQNDSLARTATKIGAQGVQAGVNTLFTADMAQGAVDNALGIAQRFIPGVTAKTAQQVAERTLQEKAIDYARMGGLNAVSSLAGTAQEDNKTAGDYIRSGLKGGAVGVALPAAFDLVGAAKNIDAAKVKDALTPKYNGLKKNEVIMDPAKLDILNEAKDVIATQHKAGMSPKTQQAQRIIDGLHKIKNENGHDFINGTATERVQRINQFLEQNGEAIPKYQKVLDRQANSEGGYAKVPGKNIAPDLNEAQRTLINDYAEMIQGMGEGNGVNINADGTRSSSNYRPGLSDKKLTKAEWFDEARRQIESGKAAYGASEDYAKLSTPKKSLPKQEVAPTLPKESQSRAVSSKSSVADLKGDDLMNEFSKMRKQYNNDAEFFDKVILNNQEAPGMIGQLARSIAGTDAREGGKSYTISQILDDELTPIDHVAEAAQYKSNSLNDLKQTARKLERDTGQKGLYNNLTKNMVNMTEDQQIAYLSKGLTAARDSGAMAAAHVNSKPTKESKTNTPADKIIKKAENDYIAEKISSAQLEKIRNEVAKNGQTVGESNPLPTPSRKALSEKQSPQSGDSRPVSPGLSSSLPDNTTTSRFGQGVTRSSEVSPELQASVKKVKPTYDKVTNEAQLATSDKLLQDGYKKATTDVLERLNAKEIDNQTVSDSIAVLKKLDEKGGTANLQQATDIAERLSEKLSKAGQTVQAASLLGNRTPEGLKYSATKALKKAGVKLTPEVQSGIGSLTEAIKSTQPGTEARTLAVGKLQQYVQKNIPSGTADKLGSFWKAGLLTGIKTQTGNSLSNTTFGILHGASNPLATMIDKGIGIFSGNRTKTITGKGFVGGQLEGYKKGYDFLKSGVDERNVLETNKFEGGEVNFKNKAINGYVNGVFRLMGAADRPAYYGQLRNSLQDLAKADGISKGLKGAELKEHIATTIKNPPEKMFQTATTEAEKGVLNYDTLLSKIATNVRKSADSMESPAGRAITKTGLNIIAPFTKVPSAFISRVFDFTPVGGLKEVVSQVSKGKFDQRALSTALSEAATGTGIIFLGAQLANSNLLSGNYPTDPKEQQRWKADKIQANSVKIGDTWHSLNYLGPIGSLFSQGKRANDIIKTGGNATDVATSATGGAVQDALGQSFLQGVSGTLDAVQDPKRYAGNFAKNQAGSVVPTIGKDFAEAGDSKQRQTNTALDAIKARVPGARNTLPVAQDVYGNELARSSDALDKLANPFRPSQSITSPTLAEVNRLHSVDPENKVLQVTPTPIGKTVTFNGVKASLNPKQRTELQKNIGQKTQDAWGQLIQTPGYKALDDASKAKALTSAQQDAAAVAQREYAAKNSLGQYAQDYTGKQSTLSASQRRLANGDVSGYTKTSNLSKSASTFAEQYDNAVANYKTDKPNLSKLKQQDTENKIAVLKIKKDYDPDTVSLYGKNKGDAYDFLSKDPNGKALADKMIAYGDALVAAGLQDTNKFRDKYGKVNIRPAEKSKGGTKLGVNSFNLYTGASNPLQFQKSLRALLAQAHLKKSSRTA